jgi:hypothetical protein
MSPTILHSSRKRRKAKHMSEEETPYRIRFRVLYHNSRENDRFAELTFRSVTKLPIDVQFALDETTFLSFEEFAMTHHGLFMFPDERILIYLKNVNTGKLASVGLSLKKEWAVAKDGRNIIGQSGFVDITDAINSLL